MLLRAPSTARPASRPLLYLFHKNIDRASSCQTRASTSWAAPAGTFRPVCSPAASVTQTGFAMSARCRRPLQKEQLSG